MKGTEKQIKWAQDIVNKTTDIIENNDFLTDSEKGNAIVKIRRLDDAAWIIENRYNLDDVSYVLENIATDEEITELASKITNPQIIKRIKAKKYEGREGRYREITESMIVDILNISRGKVIARVYDELARRL
jgi:hypothetical protein